MKERIAKVCRQRNQQNMGVMPPQVCPYCFGCPIATIVVGVSNNVLVQGQREALPIPEEHRAEVAAWLDKLEREG